MTFKDLKHVKIDGVNPLYLIFNEINSYFEEIDESKYLALFPTNERKDTLKSIKNYGTKLEILLDHWDNYDEKYMKIKFKSDEDLPWNETLELRTIIIVVRAVFHEGNKYFS